VDESLSAGPVEVARGTKNPKVFCWIGGEDVNCHRRIDSGVGTGIDHAETGSVGLFGVFGSGGAQRCRDSTPEGVLRAEPVVNLHDVPQLTETAS
jgi:hypothetical protein